jgi:hypothetical protein
MAYRKLTNRSFSHKLSQELPIWRQANSDAAFMFFQDVLERFGITDVKSYFQKWRIPIAISVIVCACIGAASEGAASDGPKGFVIGGLLGVVAPIGLLWLAAMLIVIAVFMAIYVAAWAVIIFILWLLLN